MTRDSRIVGRKVDQIEMALGSWSLRRSECIPLPRAQHPCGHTSNRNTAAPCETDDSGVVVGQEVEKEKPANRYFFRCRFSRTRMVTSMGVPSNRRSQQAALMKRR